MHLLRRIVRTAHATLACQHVACAVRTNNDYLQGSISFNDSDPLIRPIMWRCNVHALFWAVLLYGGSVFGGEVTDCPRTGLIALPNFHVLDVWLAVTRQEKVQGLSGLREADFGPRDAMLFWSAVDHPWGLVMRDMYFDLDMFFLDEQLRVVDVHRGLKAHPGRSQTPPMDYVKSVPARYAMEMRADSTAARVIEKGTQLHWTSKPALAELGACEQAQ